MATRDTSSPGAPDLAPDDKGRRRGAGASSRAGAASTLGLRALSLALLAAATFLALSGVLRADWILLDDPEYVSAQPRVAHGLRLDDARWFLSHPHAANWHPLTSWSHMLDVQMFGLRPAGHHATSLFLHVLNAVLLVLVLFRLTGAWWRSLAVAALFALHPLRVESVAWISERKDVLSGLFFVLALGAYAWWRERPGRLRYGALALALALGLMAKPMLVTLPLVLLLLDLWPLGRLSEGGPSQGTRTRAGALRDLILEKSPLFALAVASALVTFLVQRRSGAVIPVETVTPAQRITNAAISYWTYIGQTFWPAGLAAYYPYEPGTNWLGAGVATLGLVAVTAACVHQRRKRPYLVVGWLWYLIMLLPVIGIIQVGSQAHADRYTYLPAIGVLIALVWMAGDLLGRSRLGRITAAVMVTLMLAVLSVATARQTALWKDTRTLFGSALAVTRGNPLAHQCLGSAFLAHGEVERAIAELSEAVRMAPRYAEAQNNLGLALGLAGRPDEAIPHFRAALEVTAKAEIHHNLGVALESLGRTDEAIGEYEAALAIEPGHYLALAALGRNLTARGRFGEAEPHLRRALVLKPSDIELRRVLAAALTLEGRVEEAIGEYREILRRVPDDLDALCNAAWLRATHAEARHRDGDEAVRLAERARAVCPTPEAVVYGTLAAAYAEARRFPEAVTAGERAVALARAAHAVRDAERYEEQLRRYRAGRPFHFAK